jgi:membrane protein implicated in regulation of membrane protease activity
METQIILDISQPYILLAIGITLIALETFIGSFVVIWFGLGFIITAGISYFYEFSDGIWEIATVSIISLLLILFLRKKFTKIFMKSDINVSDDFFNEKGIGEIKNSKVFYKGTYWEIDSLVEEKQFFEGEKVIVLKILKNNATIKKINN